MVWDFISPAPHPKYVHPNGTTDQFFHLWQNEHFGQNFFKTPYVPKGQGWNLGGVRANFSRGQILERGQISSRRRRHGAAVKKSAEGAQEICAGGAGVESRGQILELGSRLSAAAGGMGLQLRKVWRVLKTLAQEA